LAQIGDGKPSKRAANKAKERKVKMDDDMSKYASASFIKPDDLADGPEQKTIVAIGDGQYDKPVATFDDGRKLSLNGTAVSVLLRALGKNRKDWIGQQVELSAGTLRYNGKDNAAVLVRALGEIPTADRTPLPQPADDEIPF
jgi:hypothetical protein